MPHTNFERIVAGFKHFRREYFEDEQSAFATLQHAQSPEIMVVACSDSRADPALLINARPGDIFVMRNVANLIPSKENAQPADAVMAAVEYGVKHLAVKHLIVLGHSNCGGICGLMHPEKIAKDEHLFPWVAQAAPAIEAVREDAALHPDIDPAIVRRRCEEAAVLLSTENLLSYDWIVERCADHSLTLHSWYFDMAAGDLLAYNADTASFKPLQHWETGALHDARETFTMR